MKALKLLKLMIPYYPYLPVLLLIGVALTQIYRAKYLHQPAWKGGGFGMFATTDSTSARNVAITLIIKNKTYSGQDALQVIDDQTLQNLRFRPSPVYFETLVEEINNLIWFDPLLEENHRLERQQVLSSHLLLPRAQKRGSTLPLSPASILRPSSLNIKFYRYKFQAKDFLLKNELLFQAEHKNKNKNENENE